MSQTGSNDNRIGGRWMIQDSDHMGEVKIPQDDQNQQSDQTQAGDRQQGADQRRKPTFKYRNPRQVD